MSIPILDLNLSSDLERRGLLLDQLRDALFNIGFLYITNHGVPEQTIRELTDRMPALFDLPPDSKAKLSKLHSPHFLGYSGFAEETTGGKRDLREQFDFGTELPVVYRERGGGGDGDGDGEEGATAGCGRDFSKLYWRLRGPNQWPDEGEMPGFRKALQE